MTTPNAHKQVFQPAENTRGQLAAAVFMPVLFVVLIVAMYVVAQPVAP
jgi:hypothetical protein